MVSLRLKRLHDILVQNERSMTDAKSSIVDSQLNYISHSFGLRDGPSPEARQWLPSFSHDLVSNINDEVGLTYIYVFDKLTCLAASLEMLASCSATLNASAQATR